MLYNEECDKSIYFKSVRKSSRNLFELKKNGYYGFMSGSIIVMQPEFDKHWVA